MPKRTMPVIPKTCPAVEVAGVTITGGLPVMTVILRNGRDEYRRFKRHCHANNIGWEELDWCVFSCSGAFDDLLTLRNRGDIVREWHWLSNNCVGKASGAGPEKVKGKPAPFRYVPKDTFEERLAVVRVLTSVAQAPRHNG